MAEQLERFIVRVKIDILGKENTLYNHDCTWAFNIDVAPLYASYILDSDGKLLFTHSIHFAAHFDTKEQAIECLSTDADLTFYEIIAVPTESGYIDMYKTKTEKI